MSVIVDPTRRYVIQIPFARSAVKACTLFFMLYA
jgi:hypothetical protein